MPRYNCPSQNTFLLVQPSLLRGQVHFPESLSPPIVFRTANTRRLGPPPRCVLSVQADPPAGGGPAHGADTHPGLLRCTGQRYGGYTQNSPPTKEACDEILHSAA